MGLNTVECMSAHARERDRLFPRLFEAWAERQPDATAVESATERLSYGGLDRRANGLAHALIELGVGPEQPVAICCRRTPDLIVAVLAVLKAGGAFLPLDPAYPKERLDYTMRDSGAQVLLTHSAVRLRPPGTCRVLELDAHRAMYEGCPDRRPDVQVLPRYLAYVIYTSGSTGQPKGTLLEHYGLANLIQAQRAVYAPTPADRVLQFSSPGFDASVYEIVLALANGGAVILAEPERLAPGPWLVELLREREVTLAVLPPAALALSEPRGLGRLRCVTSAGEACPVQVVARWAPGRRFLNAYGPTETTVWASVAECLPAPLPPPLGAPVRGFAMRLLDPGLSPVANGEIGELCLAGPGLARGYLGRPDLTAERFVPDPLGTRPGARLYRTGDLVRRRPNGDVEFVGRADRQVKLRGFRVELGDVEHALLALPGVRQAAVIVRSMGTADARLVAFVAGGDHAPTSEEVRAALRTSLPDHMVPSVVVALPELPRTPSGKIDRRALAEGSEQPELASGAATPRTALEERLAAIWRDVLGLGRLGVDDDFLALGGQSLMAARIAARIGREVGVSLGPGAILACRTVSELARLVEARRRQGATAPRIPTADRSANPPLSFAQEQVWFLQKLAPDSLSYSAQALIRFTGQLDEAVLRDALDLLVRRHEILRTTFPERDGRPFQRIHAPESARLPVVDLREVAPADREASMRRLVAQEIRRPFDVASLPLVRWTLYRLGTDAWVLLHAEHHFVHDGWSFNRFLTELLQAYRALVEGRQPALPELAVQFADFAAWQHAWMETDDARRQLEYWRSRLAGTAPELDLPLAGARPPVQSFRGDVLRVGLPGALCRQLADMARNESATPFMVFLAALDALLHRLTRQEDIWVGSGVADRRLPELESVIGMVINTVVLRVDVSGDPTCRELLSRVREVALGAYEHQDVPFEKVVAALRPERTSSHNPLFQVTCAFHDAPLPDLDLPGLRVETEEAIGNGSAKFDLSLTVVPRPAPVEQGETDGFTLLWEYSEDLLQRDMVERIAARYRQVLEAFAGDLDRRISEVALLADDEQHRQLVEWNRTDAAEGYRAAHERFHDWADHDPDAPAVVVGDERVTYGELARRAGAVAEALARLGVEREQVVAICCRRSADLAAAMLGVLRAGAAYLPLDPDHPPLRLEQQISGAGAVALLTHGRVAWRPRWPRPIVEVDVALLAAQAGPAPMPEPDRLAYVISTSGSTGAPKSVLVAHRGLSNLVQWHGREFGMTSGERAAMLASPAFDASTWEVMGTLANGGTLLVPDDDVRAQAEHLRDWLVHERVTVTFAPTPLAERLLDLEWPPDAALRLLLTGGDRLRRRPSEGVPFALVNAYGPAENSVVSTSGVVRGGERALAPAIGRPLPNHRAYVLDRHLGPVPIGAVGELWLAGTGLARGYLGEPGMSAERFRPDPFAGPPGARMYGTGDLARYRADGVLEFVGRADEQVKIRGGRVELGEIEHALATHPAVAQAAVLALGADGDRRLVAFVACRPGPPAAGLELRRHLQQRLPAYMVPAEFAMLEGLPLTANGKIDRRRLAALAPLAEPAAAPESEPPRDELEARLCAIWREVLKAPRVRMADDFFALGGDSLLAVGLVHEVGRQLGVELPVSAVFRWPTVAELAAAVRERAAAGSDPQLTG